MILPPKKADKSGFNTNLYLKLRHKRLAEQAAQEQEQSQPQPAETPGTSDTQTDGFNVAEYLRLREKRLAEQNQQKQSTAQQTPVQQVPTQQTPASQLSAADRAKQARQEYETYKANTRIPVKAGSGYAAAQTDTDSVEYQTLQSLKSKAEEAEEAARIDADRQAYLTDSAAIDALDDATRSALDTYAQLVNLPRNSATQSRYLMAQRTLRNSGLSDEEINNLAETWDRQKNAAAMQEKQAAAAQAAEDNPLLHNALSIPANLVGGLTGTAALVGEALTRMDGSRYSTLDPNLPGYAPSVYAGAVRQTTTENIDDGTALGKVGAVLYGATMSAADNLARIVTMGGAGSLALAGMSSFQDSVRDVTQRGGTPAQAYAMGVATAGLEVLTEKISLDRLISTKTPQNVVQLLKNAAIQGGIEVSEEELNFAGGLIADAIIMGRNSDYNRTVADLIEGGMSAEEAQHQALMNNLMQAVNVAAQSFLSGGMMSGGQAGVQVAVNGGFASPQTAQPAPVEQQPAQTQNPAQTPQTAPTQPVQTAPVQTAPETVQAPQQMPEGAKLDDFDIFEAVFLGQTTDPAPSATAALRDAVNAYRKSNGQFISNNHAARILKSPVAVELLRQRTGMVLPGTASGNRQAVREAVAALVENAEENQSAAPTSVDAAQQADNGLDQNQIVKTEIRVFGDEKGSMATPESVQADSFTPKAIGGTAPATTVAETREKVNSKNTETEYAAQVYASVDSALSETVKSWNSGGRPDPATLESAYQLWGSMSDAGKRYFLDSASGGVAAFIRAREAGLSNASFLTAYDSYHTISRSNRSSADKAERFAAALDNMVRSGNISEDQREVLREALSYDTAAGWNPATLPGSVSPDESVGAAPQGFAPYTNLQYQYGNQPDRANDFRPVNVPKRDTYGRQVTEFSANAYGAEAIPESFLPEIEQLIVEGLLGHDTRTNEESFRAAAKEIEERGEARSKNDITKAVTSGKIGENDVAKALLLFKHYANKRGERAKAAAREMCINAGQLATRSGRDLQMFSAFRRRSPTGAAVEAVNTVEAFQPYSVASRFKKHKDFAQWKKDLQDAIIDMATQIDDVEEGDVDGMRNLIRALANFRRTTAWFGNTSRLTAIADTMVNKLDFQTAKEIAVAQLSRIPDDFRQRSKGEILKAIRVQNMLSSLATVNRNLAGNSTMALVDGFSDSTIGTALDNLVSMVTKRREVGVDITRPKEFMKAATEAAQMAALCTELDIPMDVQAKYPTGRTRTFSPRAGAVSRFFSAYEKYLKYGLEVTDSFFEGGAEATVRASLQKLGAAANLSDESLDAIVKQTAARRTFKDDRKLTRAAQKTKDALNEIGTDDFGLGDLVIPFAKVGSNVAHAAIDYSSGGLEGLYEIFTLMRDAKAGKPIEPGRQRKAVTDAARGMTGLGLISVFAVLASQGVLLVSNDKDWDKRGLEQAEGLTGTQLNLSAAIRAMEGKDTTYQTGDILLGVDFMEPFNAQMRIGYLLSQEDSVADMIAAYPGAGVAGVAQALLDSPLMEGLADVVDLVDGAIESAATQESSALVDAAGQLLGTTASGFIPAPVRQAAQVIDPFYRDTSGENALEKAVNQTAAQIPFASMLLPKKYSGLGEEQRRYAEGDELLAFFNTFIAPGKIAKANPSEISGYLRELSEATGSVDIYPDYLAPSSFTVDGEKIVVSGQEKTETYQKTYGENVTRIYSDLLATEGFTELPNDLQLAALKKAKQYAADLAKKAVSGYTKSWMDKADGNEAELIITDVMSAQTGLSKERYTAAAEAGMSVESMRHIAEATDNLQPEEGYTNVRPVQEYEAIVQSQELTDEEEEAWLKIYLPDSMDQKLDTAQDMGITAEMFVAAYRGYLDNDKRKGDTVRYYQEQFGVSQEEAELLYKLYKS